MSKVKEFKYPEPEPPEILSPDSLIRNGLILYELSTHECRRFAVLTCSDNRSIWGFAYLREGYVDTGDLKFAAHAKHECIKAAMSEGRRVFWVQSLADIGDVPCRSA